LEAVVVVHVHSHPVPVQVAAAIGAKPYCKMNTSGIRRIRIGI
jgi:hypothetical protein